MLQDNEYYSVNHKAYLCLEAHLSVKDLNWNLECWLFMPIFAYR